MEWTSGDRQLKPAKQANIRGKHPNFFSQELVQLLPFLTVIKQFRSSNLDQLLFLCHPLSHATQTLKKKSSEEKVVGFILKSVSSISYLRMYIYVNTCI